MQLIRTPRWTRAGGFVLLALLAWLLPYQLNSYWISVADIAILYALWRHIPQTRPADILLKIGIGLWAAATAIHWFLFASRNYTSNRPFARAVATRLPSNVFRLDVSVPRA